MFLYTFNVDTYVSVFLLESALGVYTTAFAIADERKYLLDDV